MEVPPPVRGFPSRPTRSVTPGRLYRVHGATRLLCYRIDDTEPLADALPEGADGIWLFAFVESARVGHWSWSWAFEDVARVMGAYRQAMTEGSDAPRAPGGEPADLAPLSDFRFTRGGRDLPRRRSDPDVIGLDDMLGPLGENDDPVRPLREDGQVDSASEDDVGS